MMMAVAREQRKQMKIRGRKLGPVEVGPGILVGIHDAFANVESFAKRVTEGSTGAKGGQYPVEQPHKKWMVTNIVKTERGLKKVPEGTSILRRKFDEKPTNNNKLTHQN